MKNKQERMSRAELYANQDHLKSPLWMLCCRENSSRASINSRFENQSSKECHQQIIYSNVTRSTNTKKMLFGC